MLMRTIRIVADSAADILKLEGVSYGYAPMKVITADREFVDDDALNVSEMATYLEGYKGKSKSSCPNVNDWLEAFGEAEDVICITITAGLSGSYNAACLAKKTYEETYPDRRVFVLNSLSAGPEMALLVERAAQWIGEKMEFEEICKRLTDYSQRTGLLFMLKSLKNFANNGRVSPLVAKIVGVVGICVVGKASDEGTLEPLHKCRGESRSLEAILADMEEAGFREGKVRIAHCQNSEAAERLKGMILAKHEKADVSIHKHRGLCSFYAEVGGVLVGYEKR